MSTVDETVQANQAYARDFDSGNLKMPPSRKLAVLACMDARLIPDQILGFKIGEAHVIRNAGGIATEDALRSFIISHHLLGTREFVIINHTDCGMLTFKDEEFLFSLEQKTGISTIAPVHFHSFTDLEYNLRQQIKRVKGHPWIPKDIPVRGFIYDVRTGKLKEVASE